MRRIVKPSTVVAVLVVTGCFWLPPQCRGQNNLAPAEYDYHSLAIASLLRSAAEASKLPDIPQRIKLLIYASTILPASQHEEAVRLLDVALRDLKDWVSQDTATWSRRHTGATLRSEVLAAYARLDPEKAASLEKNTEPEATSKNGVLSLKRNDWYRQLSNRRTIADQPALMALSVLDTDPERAFGLVAQSLQEGIVPSAVDDLVRKLVQAGNRASLDRLEIVIGQTLAQSVALDPFSLPYLADIIQSDRDMPAVARTAFVGFFMRSLGNVSNILREPGINSDYTRAVFTNFTLNVRPVILKYAPEQLLPFDLLLDQMAPLVSEETRATLQAFQPEKFAEPRDRLAEIKKDANSHKRDIRLLRLVSELLKKEGSDVQENFDLAANAISEFTDPDGKAALADLLTITRINGLVKLKKFIEAQRLAGSISAEETRAWALLTLSKAAAKADRVLGFELVSNALKALDKASPSPEKVELALAAAAMLAKDDSERAFETFITASRYANSSSSKVDPPAQPPFAFGLNAKIGETQIRLGVFAESLDEVKIDPSLSVLATTDWFRADQIADDIREPSLRLQLKLQFAGAMLARESKSRKEKAGPKPSPGIE